jgi:hypothetical protein
MTNNIARPSHPNHVKHNEGSGSGRQILIFFFSFSLSLICRVLRHTEIQITIFVFSYPDLPFLIIMSSILLGLSTRTASLITTALAEAALFGALAHRRSLPFSFFPLPPGLVESVPRSVILLVLFHWLAVPEGPRPLTPTNNNRAALIESTGAEADR